MIVSVPLTENSSYDLVVDVNDKLYRTQVKKGRYHNGALEVSLHSVSYKSGKKLTLKKYTAADIDWLIAVDVEHEKFYLLDYTTGKYDGRNSIWLRVEEGQRKGRKAVLASDYEF